jgi:hypothetical protein
MLAQNKRMISKYIKLDSFNNFVFGAIKKRKYSLEKMQDFIIGYDRYNFPVFLYDVNFILPLKTTSKDITLEVCDQLGYKANEIDKISAITMLIDSSILYTVYDKKLISDLYTMSASGDTRKIIIYVVLGLIALLVLYYTGILQQILHMVGINISNTPPPPTK